MSEMQYLYETKCRRCENITEWYFVEKKQLAFRDFEMAMIDYISYPRLRKCDKCDKYTIQDLVSYTNIQDQ